MDVGSGTDSFCKYLKAKGWKSLSYDKFNNSKLSDVSTIKNNSIDLITLWHSIEHMHDLDVMINNINMKINNNGLLLIACPNINAFERKFFNDSFL